MQLPFFYIDDFTEGQQRLVLDENNSRHIVQVLRMQQGELLHLTNGKGYLLTANIIDAHKKYCEVNIEKIQFAEPSSSPIIIAISLLKNASRFEWFLEKATEIGVNTIVPIICDRTEKQKARTDRLHNILVSAMLQSRQVWLPVLPPPVTYRQFMGDDEYMNIDQKYIAHCLDDEKQMLERPSFTKPSLILIGPEGDFTEDEISLAIKNKFQPVSLGHTRLRTETAGIVAAALLANH